VLDYAKRYHLASAAMATLYQKSVQYLRQQGEYCRAQEAIEQALAIRQRIFGEEDLATAQSLDYLGELKQQQADYTAAQRYHEQALRIRQAFIICKETNEQYPECEKVSRVAKSLPGGIIGPGKPKKKSKKKPKNKRKKKKRGKKERR
jgi:tetratricopeptide (TPR) repeat protein